jgi:hypothetical protein
MDRIESSETGETVRVEEIMEAIRRQLAERELTEQVENAPDGPLPASFYEHLNQARLAHDRIEPRVQLTPPNIPVIGRLVQPLRQKLHELILFYVNQLAANQIRFNAHILHSLAILSQELEKRDSDLA